MIDPSASETTSQTWRLLHAAVAEVSTSAESMFAVLSLLREGMEEVWIAGRQSCLDEDELAGVRPAIFSALSASRSVLGAGYIFAEGTLGFTGRHIEWWQPRSVGSHSRVKFDVDPTSPSGYDYYKKEWFQSAMGENCRCVTGPLIDLQCSSSAVLTFTIPVFVGTEFVCVAAVDVSLASFQSGIAQALASVGQPCVLVNNARKVIASNDAQWLDGDRLAERPKAGRDWVQVSSITDDLGWLLAVEAGANQ